MRLLALLAAGLFVGPVFAAADKKAEPKKEEPKGDKKVKDEEAIVGTWKIVEYEMWGEKCDNLTEFASKFPLTFSSDGKGFTPGFLQKGEEWGYKLDPTAKPKAIDQVRLGKTEPGVYELDGDTLTICYRITQESGVKGDELARPSGLKDKGKGLIRMTLKRVKGEEEEKKDK